MVEVLIDSLLDGLKVFPVILIVYLLIEYIESKEAVKHKMSAAFSGRFSPLFAALIGVIPQCGFSVVATKLYQGRYIFLGTLIAVYFATSDEAIPILFSTALTNPSAWLKLSVLILIKFIYAVIVGFIINYVVKKFFKSEAAEASIAFEEESFASDDDGCCHHGVSAERKGFINFVIHPLIHSLKIILYIFIVNFILGLLIEVVIGEEAFTAFLSSSKAFQPLVCAVVGLIPNCASSVIISELYASNIISMGGALAGLTINSGLGLAVLFKDKQHIKRTFIIVGIMFGLSVIIGYSFIWLNI